MRVSVANAISSPRPAGRRLPRRDRPHREARPMTWSWPERPRRVVVTGMGAVNALGQDVLDVLGQPRGRPLRHRARSPTSTRRGSAAKIAGEVHDFDPSARPRPQGHAADRPLHPVRRSCARARRSRTPGCPAGSMTRPRPRTGVIVGSGLGGVSTLFDNVLVMAERGPDRISPFFIPMGIANVGSGQIAIATGAIGPNFATVSACATGGHALGEAWETIRRGDADMMIAGGVEAGIHEATVGGFASMKALSTRNDDPEEASRPFDQGRDGFVMGEGGGGGDPRGASSTPRRAARRRSPSWWATARRRTPRTSRCRRPAASARSGRHGARSTRPASTRPRSSTSTPTPRPRPRATRASCRRSARSSATTRPTSRSPPTSRCSGHTLGAAGAIEAIATILAIREGCIPPTINLDDPDEQAAGLDLTPNVASRRDVRVALSNSFGFGGQNTALVFRRWDG